MNPRVRVSILIICLVSSLAPIVWTLLASFGIRPDSQRISLNTYHEVQVFESRFVSEVLTSFTVAVIVAALAVTLGLLVAHALEQRYFKSRGLIVQSLLLLSSLPVLALLNGLSATLRTLGLQDTISGIALAETALYAPLAAFVIFGHLRSLPENLPDAARLEGADTSTILWKIILPSSVPALLATGVLIFVLSWNQVLMPLASRIGVSLAEDCIGTNAPGVTAHTGQASVVLGGEHFFGCVQVMYCAAAPIRDVRGQTIGFGGRILPSSPLKDRAPKYYNSEQSPLFNKSEVLYGLDQARRILTRGQDESKISCFREA